MKAMSEDRQFEALRETGWRRRLAPEEESKLERWLKTHPDRRDEWEEDAELTRVLGKLADVPTSSNFTSRVLAEVERESKVRRRHQYRRSWTNWLPRLAFAVVLLTAGISSYRFMQDLHRTRLVEGLSAVAQVSSLPGPEILKDFDAILALDQAPGPDEELLRLLE